MSAGMDGSVMVDLSRAQEPVGVYEAVLPSTETLAGMGLVVLLCVACAWFWNEKVVPVSRTNLAISKSRGEVKEYLDELRATDPKMQQVNISNTTAAFANETMAVMQEEDASVVEHDKGTSTSTPQDRALE
ncbi:MAG: hypothetical protein SGILL_007841, partial [Bacillariaceae sp.]